MLTAGLDQDYELIRATAEQVTDDPHAVEVIHQLAAWSGYFASILDAGGLDPRGFVQHMAIKHQIGAGDA